MYTGKEDPAAFSEFADRGPLEAAHAFALSQRSFALSAHPPHKRKRKNSHTEKRNKQNAGARLTLLQYEQLSKGDEKLQELHTLWPSHTGLTRRCLHKTDPSKQLQICMRYIETGGTDPHIWQQLVELLSGSEAHYEFEAWHQHFFDCHSSEGELKDLKTTAARLVAPLLPHAISSFR